MNEEQQLKSLLADARDTTPVALPPDLAVQSMQRFAKRRTRRRNSIFACAAVASLATAGYFAQPGLHPEKLTAAKSTIVPKAASHEIENLDALADQQAKLVAAMMRESRINSTLAEAFVLRSAERRMLAASACEYEAAARLALMNADRLGDSPQDRSEAALEYQNVASLFPRSAAAKLAKLHQ